MRRPRVPTALALVAPALALGGCSLGATSYANRDRPPAPVMLSGAIHASRVQLTRDSVGAGPIQIIVANLTDRSRELTFQTAGRGPGIRTTASVGPNGTVQMQVSPRPGRYELSVRGRAVEPATLRVGAARPSAQNDLMQP